MSEGEKPDILTKKEIFLKGSFLAIIVVIPSLVAFLVSWKILENLFQAIIIGGIIHFIAMGFSLKISKKFFVKSLK